MTSRAPVVKKVTVDFSKGLSYALRAQSFAKVQAALIRAQSERTLLTEAKMREFGFTQQKEFDDSVWLLEENCNRSLVITFSVGNSSNPQVGLLMHSGYPAAVKGIIQQHAYASFADLISDLDGLVAAGINRKSIAHFLYACNKVSEHADRDHVNSYAITDLAYFVSLAPYNTAQQIKLMTSGFSVSEVKELLAKGSPLALILELG
jgi:hypothetical protein